YQEASIHLWNNFLKGKLRDKTDSYILQGCYFHLKNYIRKVNERSNVISIDARLGEEGEVRLGDVLSQAGVTSDCRENLHNKFLAEGILNNGFDGREKKLLSYFAEGLTTRMIGKRMGMSHVGVVKLMQKVRIKSRKHLDKI
ncbi:MAG: hypothetical protein WC432_06270, partial [Candidatus Omnitrophota bacterium]